MPYTLAEQLRLAALSWMALLIIAGGVAVGLWLWSDVDNSIWEDMIQIPRWYAFVMGIFLGSKLLPMNITHGRTRKDFAKEAAVFILVLSLWIAILISAGWLLETVLFRIADWPQTLSSDHLFSRPTQVPLVILEYWFIFGIWLAFAAFIGAAFYRFDWNGLVLLIPAVIPVSLAETSIGQTWGPLTLLDRWFSFDGPNSNVASAAIALGSFALLMAMSWPVIRDVPIRRKSA
jgi:hypothetical protein